MTTRLLQEIKEYLLILAQGEIEPSKVREELVEKIERALDRGSDGGVVNRSDAPIEPRWAVEEQAPSGGWNRIFGFTDRQAALEMAEHLRIALHGIGIRVVDENSGS